MTYRGDRRKIDADNKREEKYITTNNAQYNIFFVLFSTMLPVSVNFPFVIAPAVFSYVYLSYRNERVSNTKQAWRHVLLYEIT